MNPLNHLRFTAMRSTAILVALATSSTVALTAQEGKVGGENPPTTKVDTAKTTIEYASLQQMVGAPVYLQASAEAKAEATREGEAVERPKAKVTEWLIDSRDGSLNQAVVSIGGFLGIGDKNVLVPANELTWNNAMERYDLGWTRDQLKAKPEFDLSAEEARSELSPGSVLLPVPSVPEEAEGIALQGVASLDEALERLGLA